METLQTFLTDESRPRAGFIPAETLVHHGTAGDNGTAGGTLKTSQSDETSVGGISSGNVGTRTAAAACLAASLAAAALALAVSAAAYARIAYKAVNNKDRLHIKH